MPLSLPQGPNRKPSTIRASPPIATVGTSAAVGIRLLGHPGPSGGHRREPSVEQHGGGEPHEPVVVVERFQRRDEPVLRERALTGRGPGPPHGPRRAYQASEPP